MKTNYRRNFRDKGTYFVGLGYRTVKLSNGTAAGTSWGGDVCNGHRGEARQKRGAKKYLRIRERIAGKELCRKVEE